MKYFIRSSESGQALVEYALLLILVALVSLSGLIVFGAGLSSSYGEIQSGFLGSDGEENPTEAAVNPTEAAEYPTEAAASPTPTEESPPDFQEILEDFLDRMNKYKKSKGHWPKSWGNERFTDLGLDASDWLSPVGGIQWNPNGDKLGLANQAGDGLQIYITDTKGKQHKLYDGWNIWCLPDTGKCYYHTVAPGNEVDIGTLEVKEEKDKKDKKDKKG